MEGVVQGQKALPECMGVGVKMGCPEGPLGTRWGSAPLRFSPSSEKAPWKSRDTPGHGGCVTGVLGQGCGPSADFPPCPPTLTALASAWCPRPPRISLTVTSATGGKAACAAMASVSK